MKFRAFAIALALTLSACGANNVVSAPVSLTVPMSPSGGTLTFPTVNGYSGTFVYSANNAVSGATATIVTIADPTLRLVPTPPRGTMLAAFELTLNRRITFVGWNLLLTTITIPPALSTSNRAFGEEGYDLTAGVDQGFNPGTLNGTTVEFPPSYGPVTLLSHTYLIVLTMQ